MDFESNSRLKLPSLGQPFEAKAAGTLLGMMLGLALMFMCSLKSFDGINALLISSALGSQVLPSDGQMKLLGRVMAT